MDAKNLFEYKRVKGQKSKKHQDTDKKLFPSSTSAVLP